MATLGRNELLDLLDRLEAVEDPLLAWGIVNEAMTSNDVDDVIDAWLASSTRDLDPDDVIDELLDAGLLIGAKDVGGGYRTRIAESVRLLVNLRQIWRPYGGQATKWRTASSLVHGIRYVRRPRQYPAYDVDPTPLEVDLTEEDSVERDVFRVLTTRSDGQRIQLAGFQARAAEQVLKRSQARHSSGVVIGAGTGSGKTLAFYLPAWAAIAGSVDRSHRLRALALYPRNELLRDQLQSGVEMAVRLAPIFERRIGRPPRVGALFGHVPQAVGALRGKYYESWTRQGDTYRCPYLSCPHPLHDGSPCHGDLVVDVPATGSHLDAALRCVSCSEVLPSDIFPVSREQLRQRPADLLYSSTEMLNRTLLDDATAPLLGIDVARGPDLVLLDEIHTYGGSAGAMTALTIRRWRNRIRSNPVFVGLSATLLDAPRFFGGLVGLFPDDILGIQPLPTESIPESAEYQLVVRADPSSGVGLLSTTIQTAMLTGRVMDSLGDPRSLDLYGQKVFAFTDDLDVTNRLYFDLLDAEGQRHRSWGPNLPQETSLAHERRPDLDADVAARRQVGQVWDLALAIGHGLGSDDRLTVGRTSSQDTGLDEWAQVVVATSSLEVGVDDDRVGAVIQHKAPRDMAAFLQRKGRAGRRRGSRPLTVVVLSDYGRDRETYEAWDQLLSSTLRPMNLPVNNVHILRMQATQAMLEWAAKRAGGAVRGQALWTALASPASHKRTSSAQAAMVMELQRAVESPEARESLAAYLARALGLEAAAVDDVMWQAPRPVLLAAAPALIRRIEDGWNAGAADANLDTREDAGARQPLPEFIPATLFSPLALPEVAVTLPPWHERRRGDGESVPMGVVQALRELAPGRITKRFAVDSDLDRAWVPVTDVSGKVDIRTFVAAYQSEGAFGSDRIPLLRPLSLQTEQPDSQLRDSSNGRPVWRTEIRPTGSGNDLRVVPNDPLGSLVGGIQAHLHRDQCHVEVVRGMVGSDVSLVFKDGSREQGQVGLVHDELPVALGAVHDVDGLLIEVNVDVTPDLWAGPLGGQLRRARFRGLVASDPLLQSRVGPFGAELVHDAVLTGILHRAVRDGVDLAGAWEGFSANVDESIETVLRSLLTAEVPEDGEAEQGADDTVASALQDPEVLELVGCIVPCLWEEANDEDLEWLRLRAVRTIGELLLGGSRLLCPDQDPEGILIDIEPEGSRRGTVWLTEATVGGGGFLEAVVDAAASEPSRLLRLARASLRPGVASLISSALTDLVQELPENDALSTVFSRYRNAERTADRARAIDALAASLQNLGISATPDIIGSVANRLLRPGSTPRTDELVRTSLTSWMGEEARLGVEIPLRIWCFLDASRDGPLDERKLDDLQSMLWPRGSAPRDAQLTSHSPFSLAPEPSASLAQLLLTFPAVPLVDFVDVESTWAAVRDALRENGVCRVRADARDQDALLLFLAHTTTNAVELDWLRLYCRVATFERDGDGSLWIELDIPEVRT